MGNGDGSSHGGETDPPEAGSTEPELTEQAEQAGTDPHQGGRADSPPAGAEDGVHPEDDAGAIGTPASAGSTTPTAEATGWATPGGDSPPGIPHAGTASPGVPPPTGPVGPPHSSPTAAEAPTAASRGPRTGLVLLVIAIGVVGLAGLAAMLLVLLGDDSGETIRARGGEVTNAEPFLEDLELSMDRARAANADSSAEVATDGNVRCWFSYPDGREEPNDFVRCGPMMFADSMEGTHWLRVPVSFRGEGGDVRVGTADPGTRRTWALDDGEQLVRPDGRSAPEDPDLSRPPAEIAESGRTGRLPASDLMLDLEAPSGDSRLVGTGYAFTVQGWATTRTAAVRAEAPGRARVLEAAEGEEWLIVELTDERDAFTEDRSGNDPVLGGGELSLTVVADDTTVPLGYDPYVDASVDSPAYMLASVPADAEEVALSVDDGILEQSWSFTDGARIGDTPEVLLREPGTRRATVPDDLSLPYAAHDLLAVPGEDFGEFGSVPAIDESEPFGANELELHIDEMRLDYAVPMSIPLDGSTPDFHTASGPDRALLHPVGLTGSWGDLLHAGYTFNPEDAVVTLEDGTTIEPTTVGEPDVVNPLFDGAVMWEVPADIESATITLSPRPGNDEFDLFELDFQDGTLDIPVDFSS